MAKKENWADYKEIKSQVSLKMVLEHYGLMEGLKQSGKNWVGCCPIHKGTNSKQFSVNLERSLWNCFGNCQAGGNVLDFVAKIEGLSIHDAALLLQNRFLKGQKDEGGTKTPPEPKKRVYSPLSAPDETSITNQPLKFQLKTLVPDHPFFVERNILPDTVKHFGLGYCDKGLLKGRIAIPIHDERGQLVAYCGRAVSPEQSAAEGKYKLPPKFHKALVVYNLHNQAPSVRQLIVVESYLSVFSLFQAGLANVVALMGTALSDQQADLISAHLGPAGQVILLFDKDEGGQAGAQSALVKLAERLFVKCQDLPAHVAKPHQLAPDEASRLLGPSLLP